MDHYSAYLDAVLYEEKLEPIFKVLVIGLELNYRDSILITYFRTFRAHIRNILGATLH